MSVSYRHERLVLELIGYLNNHYDINRSYSLYIDNSIIDSKISKPPMINGYCPDLYAKKINGGCVIVGEAKTPKDLEAIRSQEQLEAFCLFLAKQPEGILLLATPWITCNRAKSIIKSIVRKNNISNITFHVIENLSI